MAWGVDNQTLYYSDAHTKVISKCDYNLREVDVTNCETLFDVAEKIDESSIPGGMATDLNGHLWFVVSGDAGKVLEINPETGDIVTEIGKVKIELK